MSLEVFATDVASNMDTEEFKFDPMIILVIIELLSEVLPILMDICNKDPEDVIAMGKSPNRWEGAVTTFKARKAARNMGYTWREAREMSGEVTTAMFKTAAKSTPADVQAAYDAV